MLFDSKHAVERSVVNQKPLADMWVKYQRQPKVEIRSGSCSRVRIGAECAHLIRKVR